MAYSDWGGFVFSGDGVHRPDREDVAVFDDQDKVHPSGARIFANLTRQMDRYPEGGAPWHEHSHHVVLGDGPVRLCGYKQRPELWHRDDGGIYQVDLDESYVSARDDDGDAKAWQGSYAGTSFFVVALVEEHERLALTFTDEDGVIWHARCGYLYGAGFGSSEQADKVAAHEEWRRWMA